MTDCQDIFHHWYNWYPQVGILIGVAGAIGIVIPWLLSSDSLQRQKYPWSALIALLVGLELRSITLDARQRDAGQALASCKQLNQFKDIAGRLEQSITENNAHFDQEARQTAETQKEIAAHGVEAVIRKHTALKLRAAEVLGKVQHLNMGEQINRPPIRRSAAG
jgi:hypothetical protein